MRGGGGGGGGAGGGGGDGDGRGDGGGGGGSTEESARCAVHAGRAVTLDIQGDAGGV